MSQLVLYWVEDDGDSRLSDAEWQGIEALQKQTNLREYLHRGRVGFVRSTYEPRWPQIYSDSGLPEALSPDALERHIECLLDRGWTWEDLVRARLAARVPAGIHGSGFLLAGQSEVSDLKGDVRLTLRFLLKASTIAPDCNIHVAVDGDVRVPELIIRDGSVRPDPKGLSDHLEILRGQDDGDAAAALLEGVDSGDYFGPSSSAADAGA